MRRRHYSFIHQTSRFGSVVGLSRQSNIQMRHWRSRVQASAESSSRLISFLGLWSIWESFFWPNNFAVGQSSGVLRSHPRPIPESSKSLLAEECSICNMYGFSRLTDWFKRTEFRRYRSHFLCGYPRYLSPVSSSAPFATPVASFPTDIPSAVHYFLFVYLLMPIPCDGALDVQL